MLFVEWMKEQNIETIVDFDNRIKIKYEVLMDLKHVKCNNKNNKVHYEASKVRYGQTICKRRSEIENVEWRKSISEMKPNRSIIIHNMLPISINEVNKEINIPFNEELTLSIMQRKAVAASDASVKDFSMGGC